MPLLLDDDENILSNCEFRKARNFLHLSSVTDAQLKHHFGLNGMELNCFENSIGQFLKRNTACSFAFSSRTVLLIGLNYMRKGFRFSDIGNGVGMKLLGIQL